LLRRGNFALYSRRIYVGLYYREYGDLADKATWVYFNESKICLSQAPENQSKSLNILHIIRGLANSSGTTHIVNPLAEAQGRLGHIVRVLYVDKPPMPAVLPDSKLVASRGFALSLPLDNPGFSWDLARAMKAEVSMADVVHVHAVWNFPTWWAMRTADRIGVPYIVAPQGSFDPWALGLNAMGKRLYGYFTERPLLQRAAALQALTVKEAAQFRAAGLRAPVHVIPNGIAGDLFVRRRPSALAQRLGLASDERVLLFLSRVHPKKGLDVLLPAFLKLRERHRVTLVVAGSDRGSGHLETMRALSMKLGLGDSVRFIGEVAGEEKLDLIQSADAFALISHSEGLPVAAVEALGAGLPSVLSSECNLPEVEACRAGWVVPPNQGDAASALIELFDDPVEAAARGRRAAEMVQKDYTWQGIAARTLDLYRELTRTRAGSVG
jgi:glycosyltransferase involved in cell wall biosynthesis